MFQQDLSSVVIDVGSCATKAGYSGQDSPKYVVPSFVGDVKNGMIEEAQPEKYYIGDSYLNLKKQGMDINKVYSEGRIINFEGYEKLIQGLLTQEMRIDPSNFSILLSEDNVNDRNERERIANFVFETLQIKNLFFCKAAVLSCFSTGRSTAVVVDCGTDQSSVTTVHDGFALSKTSKKSPIGGETLTKQVQKYIQTQIGTEIIPRVALKGTQGLTQSFLEYHKNVLLRDIKQTLYRVDQTSSESDLVEYQLPDKNVLKLDRTKVNNPFLNTSTDPNYKGLHHLIHDNINQCDVDIKKQLYGNMIVTGGNSLVGGLINKLQSRVGELAPANVKLKLITFPFSIQRRFAPWIGGSIVASLSSFQSFWVGAQEWKEYGSSILDKKCA